MGQRHNFLFYISAIEREQSTRSQSTRSSRLGKYIERGHAQGSWREFVEAHDYIFAHYSGDVRARLMDALDRAYDGKSSFDGSIEWGRDGVTLRALSKETQTRDYDAEVYFAWETVV